MKLLIGIMMLAVLVGCKSGGSSSSSLQESGNSSDNLIPEVSPPDNAQPMGSYKLEIQWEQPSTRKDGSQIDVGDIKQYRIHYGREAFNLDSFVEVDDAVNLTEVIELPDTGLWYVSMTTIDSAGLESELSGAEPVFICEDSNCNG